MKVRNESLHLHAMPRANRAHLLCSLHMHNRSKNVLHLIRHQSVGFTRLVDLIGGVVRLTLAHRKVAGRKTKLLRDSGLLLCYWYHKPS